MRVASQPWIFALLLVGGLASACVARPAATSRSMGRDQFQEHRPLRAQDVRGLHILTANLPAGSWTSPLPRVLAATRLDAMLAAVLDPDGTRLPDDAFTPVRGLTLPRFRAAAAVGDPDRGGPGVSGPVHTTAATAASIDRIEVLLRVSAIVLIAAIALLPLGCSVTSRRLYPPPVARKGVPSGCSGSRPQDSVPHLTPPPPVPAWPTEWPPPLILEIRWELATDGCPQFPPDGALVFPPEAFSVFASGREKADRLLRIGLIAP